LVHGWSCDRTYWSEQVGPLSAEYRVITIDLGGHGESGLERKDWTIASFGGDVAAVVKSLGLDSVVLVGHSMGGDVIFQAARLLPGKVEALIMLDTYKELGAWRSDSEIDEIVAEFEADFSRVTERYVRGYFPAHANQTLVNRIATDMAAAPPAVALSALRSSFRHAREVPALIKELGIPVITINPDDAPTDLTSMSNHGVDVLIMAGVGHFLMMENPAEFNEQLLSTLDDVD
jgi:pimeloyl-ACP methyl ester carboxylesterase